MKWIKRIAHFLRRRVFIRPYFFRFFLPSHPVSRNFGCDRGNPVDRYYIDRFIAAHSQDIRGDVLEVGDPGYTPRFGRNHSSLTILHYAKEVYQPTIVGDLERHDTLPMNRFDCFICPQTFQYIYDFEKGIRGAFRMLKEGGVLLATLPALSQSSVGRSDPWREYWRFRKESVQRGFEAVFGSRNMEVQAFGNVRVGVSFYYGLSMEDIPESVFEVYDPDYPFLFTVRAIKRTQLS